MISGVNNAAYLLHSKFQRIRLALLKQENVKIILYFSIPVEIDITTLVRRQLFQPRRIFAIFSNEVVVGNLSTFTRLAHRFYHTSAHTVNLLVESLQSLVVVLGCHVKFGAFKNQLIIGLN